MIPGEPVTLEYTAEIKDEVDAGDYKDLAWTKGTDLLHNQLLGLADEVGFVDTNFVGTNVAVAVENPDPVAEAEVDEETREEEVLGSSTVRLPATGSATTILISALAILALGLTMVVLSRKKKIATVLPLILIALVLGTGRVHAETSNIFVRLEDP